LRCAGASLTVVNLGTGRLAKSISCGFDYSCVTLDDDTIKCFGRGSYGMVTKRPPRNLATTNVRLPSKVGGRECESERVTPSTLLQMGRGDTADVDDVSDLPGIDLPGPIVACNADY